MDVKVYSHMNPGRNCLDIRGDYVSKEDYDALAARLAAREAGPLARRAVRLEAGFRAQEIRIARLEGLLRQCNAHGRLDGTAVLQEIEVALADSPASGGGEHG